MAESNTEVTKEVTMVGYDADQRYGSVREFADQLTDVDALEESSYEAREVHLVIDLGMSIPTKKKLYAHDYKDEDLERLKRELDNDQMSIEDSTEVKTEHKNSFKTIAAQLGENLCEEISDMVQLEGEDFVTDNKHHRRVKWTTGDGRCEFSLKSFSIEERRVLSKEEKREDDDLYETMAAVPSVSFQLKIKADDNAVVDAVSEEIIPVLHKGLAKTTGVGKVRYTSCERQERKKGECYDI